MDIEREILAFTEKIGLAELEEAKAHERVMELKYQLDRFKLDSYLMKKAEDDKRDAVA